MAEEAIVTKAWKHMTFWTAATLKISVWYMLAMFMLNVCILIYTMVFADRILIGTGLNASSVMYVYKKKYWRRNRL